MTARLMTRYNLELSEMQHLALEAARLRETVYRKQRGKKAVSKAAYLRFCLELDLPVDDVEAAKRCCARSISRLRRTQRKQYALQLMSEAFAELTKNDKEAEDDESRLIRGNHRRRSPGRDD